MACRGNSAGRGEPPPPGTEFTASLKNAWLLISLTSCVEERTRGLGMRAEVSLVLVNEGSSAAGVIVPNGKQRKGGHVQSPTCNQDKGWKSQF